MLGDSDFDERFEALIVNHRIDVVFPTVDAVVERVAARQFSARVVAPSAKAAHLCADKAALYAALGGEVTLPRIYGPLEVPTLPCYAKPARGGGGRGAYVVCDATQLAVARRDGLIVQELLTGPEVTVDALGGPNGETLGAFVRGRDAIGRSISLGTATQENTDLEEATRRIGTRIGVAGPFFAQFKQDAAGVYRLLEVNARVGGSMTLTRLAGVNIPQLAVHLALGQSVQVPRRLHPARGVRHLTTLMEWPSNILGVIWDLDDTLVRADGKAEPEMMARLYALRNLGIRQWVMTLNVDPEMTMRQALVPDVFEAVIQTTDKLEALSRFEAEQGVQLKHVLMVNDSNREKLEMQQAYPELVALTPDAVALLPYERWS
ncbi:MAG: carbamoyl-phosphate synthase large subunit [Flavobacteriales bacterium]|jgi:carbamoyl-phosphate synthase large subunit